jgi:hypothetical protein
MARKKRGIPRHDGHAKKLEALVPYAGTNRIRSAGISQPRCPHIASKKHPDKKTGSLLELAFIVKKEGVKVVICPERPYLPETKKPPPA